MLRVTLCQFDGFTTLRALPLAAGLLTSAVRADPDLRDRCTVTVLTGRKPLDDVLASMGDVDVLGLSTYTWNRNYTLTLAARYRETHPDTHIVLGGPSAPRAPDAVAAFLAEHPAIDTLVLGEGERTFVDLLTALHAGDPVDAIPGVATRAGVAAPRARMEARDFAPTASPYLDGTFDTLLAELGSTISACVIETNRGCPFKCTYCDWGQAIASRVHEVPLDRIHGDLAWIAEHRIPYVYIVDANFGIRRRDVGILEEMGRQKQRTGFPLYCYFHLTKNAHERNLATVRTLHSYGIGCQVALSMQAFDGAVLKAIKRDNISLERSLALRQACNEDGIPTFNELILGLPEQTYTSFTRSLDQAITPYPGDTFYLYLARLLDNAQMASPEDRTEFGLETRWCVVGAEADLPVEEAEEVVVGSRAMPVDAWKRSYRFGYFLAAAYNLKLLDAVVAWVKFELDAPLTDWVEAVLQAPGLADVNALFDRYTDAILDGRGFFLPVEGVGNTPRRPEEAVVSFAARYPEAFYAAVEDATLRWTATLPDSPDTSAVSELFRYQALTLPRWRVPSPSTHPFDRDWPAWHRRAKDGARLEVKPVTLRTLIREYVAAPSMEAFTTAHLAALYAKSHPAAVAYV